MESTNEELLPEVCMSIYGTELGLLANLRDYEQLCVLKGEALVEKAALVESVVTGSLCGAYLFGFKKKAIVKAK
eukprot:279739-Lingulodinium_polyedra.AAC.1